MAAMGLPGTDQAQLRKQAKDWLHRGRSGDPEALRLLRQRHPRGEELATDPRRLRLGIERPRTGHAGRPLGNVAVRGRRGRQERPGGERCAQSAKASSWHVHEQLPDR